MMTWPMTKATAAITAGTGMGPILPAPRNRNACGRPTTGSPPLKVRAMPRAAINMPSVAMKAGSLALAIRIPLISPASAPARMPAAMPPQSPKLSICWAATTLTNASREPTERSMPALRMAKVWPIEISARIEIWRETLVRFITLQKFGLMVPNKMQSTTSTAGMPMRPQGTRRKQSRARGDQT